MSYPSWAFSHLVSTTVYQAQRQALAFINLL